MLFCLKISLCCHLRCFVAKSILSRFTRFCVEKNLGKNCVCGEKRTNIRYVHFIAMYQFYTYIKTDMFVPGNAGSPFWTFCSTFPRTILLPMMLYYSRYVGYRYVIWINVLKFEVTSSSEWFMMNLTLETNMATWFKSYTMQLKEKLIPNEK